MKLSFQIKRKVIQLAAFGFCNAKIQNFFSGKLYTGKWKKFCAPGLNCYSCPAALVSCPIGAMQAVGGSKKFDFSFYVAGIILAFGVVLGRAVCGFLCPFGLFQELLHKIPSPKAKLWKALTYIKYAVLLFFVMILPVADRNFAGSGDPAFCEYICPAGIAEGALPLLATHPELGQALGWRFILKICIFAAVFVTSIFVYRFFCKMLCPLGAIYGLLNKISFYHVHVNKEKCISCGKCSEVCPMDNNPLLKPRSAECILCGRCADICPAKAIRLGF
ncbi:MAG: 4Fe-4S binding protein [Treponema sp.]|nr:4Fe-4S binding protein [Treponema sp.]